MDVGAEEGHIQVGLGQQLPYIDAVKLLSHTRAHAHTHTPLYGWLAAAKL